MFYTWTNIQLVSLFFEHPTYNNLQSILLILIVLY